MLAALFSMMPDCSVQNSAASEAELADGAYSYGGSRSTNPRASSRAESSDGIANGFDPSATTIGGGAIPAFRELSDRALAMDEPATRLTIVSPPTVAADLRRLMWRILWQARGAQATAFQPRRFRDDNDS